MYNTTKMKIKIIKCTYSLWKMFATATTIYIVKLYLPEESAYCNAICWQFARKSIER